MNSKYYKPIVFLRTISVLLRRIKLPIQLFTSGFCKSPSYYPELPRKSEVRILSELLAHVLRYGSIEWHYFTYGFDVKDFRNRYDYMDESDFIWQNNTLNMIQSDMDYTCILRDKALFAELLTTWGYKTPHSIAEIHCEADAKEFILKWRGESLFCKPKNGQCGQGAFKVIASNNKYTIDGVDYLFDAAKDCLTDRLSTTSFIIQNVVEQHSSIDSIYPLSLNTLRITTYFDRVYNCAVPYAAFFRVGAKGKEIDNWAAGGILIGVDLRTGTLGRYGFYKHGYGGKTERHPDTDFVFSGFPLPHYEAALHQALSLHEKLNGIPVIGWDIALTKNGVLFIEGNDNIEIGPIQIAEGRGMKASYLNVKKRCLGQ